MTNTQRLAAAGLDPALFSSAEAAAILADADRFRQGVPPALPLPPALPSVSPAPQDDIRSDLRRMLDACLTALEKNALLLAFDRTGKTAAAVAAPFLALCDALPDLLTRAEDQLDDALTQRDRLEQTLAAYHSYTAALIQLDAAAHAADLPAFSAACRAALGDAQIVLADIECKIGAIDTEITALTDLLETALPDFLDTAQPLLTGQLPDTAAYRAAALCLRGN